MSGNEDAVALKRRSILLGAPALAGGLALAGPSRAGVRTNAKIVIIGAGAAGLATASRLADRLEGASITLVDRRREHLYQPGYTLVAAGLKSADYTVSTTREFVARGVTLIEEAAGEIDPVGKTVTTDQGKRLPYDFLVVATGLELNYAAIEGWMWRASGRMAWAVSMPGQSRQRPPGAPCQPMPIRGALLSLADRQPR